MHSKKKSIIFLTPYPVGQAPSQRFRFEQYFELLKEGDIHFTTYSFLTQAGWSLLYAKGKFFQKTWHLFKGFVSRVAHVFLSRNYDYVFIHREVSPIGPPVFEWVIAKLLRKKIIYDFDDAIWMTDKLNESWIEKTIRWRSKVGYICSWSYRISCGNDYLCDFAQQFNPNVTLNPTTIDTEYLFDNEIASQQRGLNPTVVIGWTGSHSTLKYLKLVEPVLQQLENQYSTIRILVIADKKPDLNLKGLDFLRWNKESEVPDLQKIDIGIMPLPDDDWTKGKCGFKALQYMSIGVPCVVSPVGVNTTIVDHGVNGYWASSDSEWLEYLSNLIKDSSLRKQMGVIGKKKVSDQYSVKSNAENFVDLFN